MKCPHCGAPNRDEARFCGACGRATSATEPSRAGDMPAPAGAPDLTGREIGGRYRILAKLGEGGMGAVYRGEQISLKRKCAIKLLKPELSADPGLVRRFNAEAELVARLSHPNVVNIYDFGQDVDGTLYIAMEYIEGRSLRAVINSEGPLPPRRAIAIAAQVASSLMDAHAHGIVHRDLKPDNVMLTERGRDKDVVRVLDFGIAKLRDENKHTVQAMTQAGDLVGTPQYMAPEQIRGDRVDGRTDVYALGAMIYEMITGRLPFEGPTVMAILSKHLMETPPPPSVRRPDLAIPPALDALVMSALAKDPEQRIASMEQVGEQLAAIALQLGGSPSQPFVIPGVAGLASAGPMAAAADPQTGWRPGMPTHAGAPAAMTPMPMPAHPHAATPPPPGAHATPHAPYPVAPMTPPPNGTPPPMPAGYPMHAPPAPAPRRSRAGLWIAIALLVVGAGVAAIVVATRGSKHGGGGGSDASGSTGSDGSGSGFASDDPWAGSNHGGGGSGGTGDDGSGTGTDTPASLDGTTYVDPAGWSVLLPPGFPAKPSTTTAPNGATITGFNAGASGGIAIIAVSGLDPDMSDPDLMRQAQDFAKQMGGTLFSFDFVTAHGARRLRAVYDLGDNRLEAVLYLGSPTSLIAMFGVDRAHFDGTEAMRRELFDRRINPPSSP